MSPRRCACSTPAPIEVEGRSICEQCGERLPDDRDRMLAEVARQVIELRKRVAELEDRAVKASQLTRAERRKRITKALRTDPERADRDIARSLGVSPSTVAAVRRKLKVSKLDESRS